MCAAQREKQYELSENDIEMEQPKAAFRRMIYSLPDPRDALVLTEFEGFNRSFPADSQYRKVARIGPH